MYVLNSLTSRIKRGGIGVLIFSLLLSALSAISITPANAFSGVETSGLCSSTVGETDRASIAQLDNDCVLTFFAATQTTSSNSNSWSVPAGVREASILVVAGGGAGGVRHGGGGGAGGLVYLENVGVNSGGTAIAINVGGGGAGSNSTSSNAATGSNSTVTLTSAAVPSTVITAVGGSGGGHNTTGTVPGGGSSGGGGGPYGSSAATQGNQNYGFGSTGGAGTGSGSQGTFTGGGGGGAGGAGGSGSSSPFAPGTGGSGKSISITGSGVCYAAGGGGGGYGASASTLSNGGFCTAGQLVGGSGSLNGSGTTRAASNNTGSGGGGGGFNDGSNAAAGSGSAGIVIIRWTIPGSSGAFPDVAGISARFNASNFNTSLNSGLGTWADTSGSGFHIASTNISGTAITMGTSGSNANGSSKTFNVVNGTTGSNILMLSAANMTGKYTLFTVARYSGATKARIFQGVAGNYLHGFYYGSTGVLHNNAWRTPYPLNAVTTNTNWLMSSECTYDPSPGANSCTSTMSAQGKQTSTVMNTVSTSFGLAVNNKGAQGGEISDFQIADVIVFNRVLTIPEENSVEKYLSDKYGISIYSDLVANFDPGDSGTTKTTLKNLSKGSGYLADDLDLTLYGGALKSSSNGGSINLDRADSSFGQSAAYMRLMSKFSAEIWVKPRADQGSYDFTSLITMLYTSGGQQIYPSIVMSGTYFGSNAMRVEGGFYSGSNWRMSGGLSAPTTSYKILPDTWYHLATTYDGTNVRFFVNGVQNGNTVATTDVLLRGDSQLRIGTRWDGGADANGFNGLIGKIKIYDYGRTADEVLGNYNADKSRYECGSTTSNTNGDVRVTFTTAGSCSWQAPAGVTKVNALLVGGGGGGGAWVGGGGGGGGVLEQNSVTVTPNSTYPITVGGGGGGSYFSSGGALSRGANGGSSSALGLTAYGGGRGATWNQFVSGGPGVATGGGGATASSTGSFGTPDISPAQGYAGGAGTSEWSYGYPTGGGGGAGGAGGAGATTGNPRASGNGGAGKASNITGVLYGGGGGGGCHGNGSPGSCVTGSGVNGGGNGAGNGSAFLNTAALFKGGDGSDNYGGGGGGSGAPSVNSYSVHSQGGTGGSGIVVLQYFIGPTITGVTSSSSNGNYILGSTISLQVSFSESVTVTGTPTLTVETGSTDRAVAYSSGSGTSSLTFTYTVQTGDVSSDLDYTSTSALLLAGGTIRDASSNNAILTLASPGASGSLGASKALVVDGAVPTYVSAAVNTAGTKVILTYSETLSSTTAATSSYSVTVAGTSAAISSVAVSGSTVELTMSSRIATGQLVNFTYTDPTSGDDTNAIQDSLGNDAASKTSTAVTNNSSLVILGTPSGFSLSASAIKSITATWSAVTNASSYTVKLYDSTGATLRATKTGVTSPTSYTFTTSDYSLVDGDTYQVGVTAIGNSTTYLDSNETAKVSITTSSNLSVPSSVVAGPTDTSPNGKRKSIDLTWGAVANVSSYTVKIYDISTGGTALATVTGISSSATSTTLTTSQYASMLDKTTYYITITSIGNGSTYLSSAESSRVSVTTHAVASSVSISTNPSSQSKTVGQAVTFSVSATATDLGTLSYLWKKGSTVVGTNSSSYTFTTTATSDAADYTVVVTNTLNGVATSATSSAATLSMSSALSFNSRADVTVTAGTALTGGTSILVTAINGRTERSYAVTAGTLPTGLSLNSATGAITGTPTVAGTYSGIKITVTDANSATLQMASGFTITVNRGSQLPISIVTRYGTGGVSLNLAIQGGSGNGTLTYTLDPNPQTSCQLSGSVITPSFATGASGTCYVKATKAADAGFTATSSVITAIFFTAYVPVVVQTMTCPAGTVPSNPSGIGVGSCMQVLAPVSTSSGDSGAAPKITALSLATAAVGAQVVITGTGFSTATKVQFGSKSTTTFTATSTTITVNVPTGATTGRVMVFSPTGTAMASQIFTVITSDVRAPAYLSGNINTSVPTQVTLNFDESLASTALSASAFGVTVAGLARTVNSVSISGSTITLTLASAVSTGQSVLFTYTSPGDSTSIQDVAGNKTGTIVATALTNTL